MLIEVTRDLLTLLRSVFLAVTALVWSHSQMEEQPCKDHLASRNIWNSQKGNVTNIMDWTGLKFEQLLRSADDQAKWKHCVSRAINLCCQKPC